MTRVRPSPGRAARGPGRSPSRVVIEDPRPCVDGGRFAAKGVVGQPLVVEADVFADGHDHVAAELRWRRDNASWHATEMTEVVDDRFRGSFVPDRMGRWCYTVAAWVDHYASWRWGTRRKVDDGQDVVLELGEGALLIEEAAGRASAAVARRKLERAARSLREGELGVLDDRGIDALVRRFASRDPVAELDGPVPVWVDRPRAGHSAWYEFFPRSVVGDHGLPRATLSDAIDRLDYIAELGFDVVYLPPVHPIGRAARKGPNNDPAAGPEAVGSPWAIGNEHGGHCAVDPDLGTVDDIARLAEACRERSMELALDLAFQCSPDHPWVREHPEWFRHRPDGSIHYAENPPKRYQDIYPLDFESPAWAALWSALRDVVRFWMDRGVRIFRVDNPHTKPFAFWEWLIDDIRRSDPDVLFLSEAFTRPKVMKRLAKLGFTQSYTYFAWRVARWELEEYLTELTSPPVVDYFRPNAWPNTPDILTEQLQRGGRPVFAARAVLAATLCANYGIYGPAFELVETRAVREGSEEYLDSEKYQVRHWDLDAPHTLAPLLSLLNDLRRRHPALQQDRTLAFHPTNSDDLICYSKRAPAHGDLVVCVVNLSASERRSGLVHLRPEALGRRAGEPLEVVDELGGARFRWTVGTNYVELDPHSLVAHVLAVTRGPEGSRS